MKKKKASVSPMTFFSFQDIMACVTGIMILVTLIMALDPLADEPSKTRASAEVQAAAAQLAAVKKRLADAQQAITNATAALEEARTRPQVTAEQLARMEKLLGDERSGMQALQRSREEAEGDAKRREDRVIVLDRDTALAEDNVRAIKQDLADKVLRSRVKYQTGVRETLQPLLFEITPQGIFVGELDEKGTPRKKATVVDEASKRVIEEWRVGMQAPTGAAGGSVKTDLDPILAAHPKEQWYALLVVRADTIGAMNGLRDMLRGSGYEVGWQLWDESDGGFFDTPEEAP